MPPGEPTAGETERARALGDPQRAHEFLAGRLLLRVAVADAFGVEPTRVRPAYRCPPCGPGEHGAPAFVLSTDDGAPARPLDVAASFSRAGGWALMAVEVGPGVAEVGPGVAEAGPGVAEAGPRAIGVDLALVADFRGAIPDAAYSAAERRRLFLAKEAPAEAARLWVRKEAVLKARGTGLRTDPATVETLGDPCVMDLDGRELGLPAGFAAAVYLGSGGSAAS